MDEKELTFSEDRDAQEFSLEDIMKEFSPAEMEEDQQAQEEEEEQLTLADESPAEPEQADEPEQAEAPAQDAAAMSGDTVPIPVVQGSQMAMGMGDTIRVGVIAGKQEQKTEEEEIVIAVQEPETEPFSEDWEPEYEQPIGEYVPPRPILFQSRSKLHELKRKLVAGPERRYYELGEQGVGKLQLSAFICLIVVILSAVATVMDAMGLVPENRLKFMVFSQFFAMLICATLGCYRMMDGIASLLKGKFTLNTMLTVTFLVCCADGVFGLREQRVPCCAAFGLQVFMSLLNDYHNRSSQMGMTDTLRKANYLKGVVRTERFYDGRAGLLRGEGEVEDFMDHYAAQAKPDKTLSMYALIALGISLVVAMVAGVLHLSVSFGVQVLSVSLLAAVPVSAFVVYSRPLAILTKRLHKLGAVLCGWQGVEAMCGKVMFPVGYADLFPAGACKLNGMKFYGARNPDDVIAYCAALILADGGGLAPMFDHLLSSRNGRHYDAENLRGYEGGLGGEIKGESVLMGDLELLKEMGVEIPEGISVSQAVYAAIDGELCGVFAVTYSKVKSSAAGINTLSSYRGLYTVLASNDFMLTEEFVRARFNVSTKRILFPDPADRDVLAEILPPEEGISAALITTEGLAPFAYAVTGARALRTASRLGMIVSILGGALGLCMMLVLAILGVQELLTPANMFLYQLVWLVPGLLLTEWTRSV